MLRGGSDESLNISASHKSKACHRVSLAVMRDDGKSISCRRGWRLAEYANEMKWPIVHKQCCCVHPSPELTWVWGFFAVLMSSLHMDGLSRVSIYNRGHMRWSIDTFLCPHCASVQCVIYTKCSWATKTCFWLYYPLLSNQTSLDNRNEILPTQRVVFLTAKKANTKGYRWKPITKKTKL